MRPWLYSTLYRLNKAPWDLGVRPHLKELVESGRIATGRDTTVLDLGSGTGSESVYLAQRGCQVVGVDYTKIAVERARAAASKVGVEDHCRFVRGDITASPIPDVAGTYDVILDFGALDDMVGDKRRAMADVIHRYAHPGTIFVLWCFYAVKKELPRFRFSGASQMLAMLNPGEEQKLFGAAFDIERLESPEHTACFVMTRR